MSFLENTDASARDPGDLLQEYSAVGKDNIELGGEIKPLVAEFSREGVDLTLHGDNGDYITVTDYFASFPSPDLITEGGARLTSDIVSKLAGPGPLAQSTVTQSDVSPIGEFSELTGTVLVKHSDGTSEEAVEGSAVFKGDVLETARDGNFVLTFIDDTKFSMGPSGRAVLDDLIYNENDSSGNGMGVSLLQGVFSFVSGQIAKDDPESVNIRTPVGTIGIRGTSWSGKIAQLGEESLFTLFTGAIIVTNEGGSQLLNLGQQSVIVTSSTISPGKPFILTEEQLIDAYGKVLSLINPDWALNDEDFDPNAIAPAAGPRGGGNGGGGAGFGEFELASLGEGLGLAGILQLSDLLDGTEFELPNFSGAGDNPQGGVNPGVEVRVSAVSGPDGSTVSTFNIEIVLDAPTNVPVTIFYEVIPGTATNVDTGLPGDVDFIDDGGGVIILPPGATSRSFSVTLVDDDVIEDTEFFLIRLTGAENAVLDPFADTALIIIEDNDVGIVSISPVHEAPSLFAFSAFSVPEPSSDVTVDEGAGSVQFRFVLDKAVAPGVEVRVDYTVSGEGASRTDFTDGEVRSAYFSGGENGLLPGPEIIVEIAIVDDEHYQGDQIFSVNLVGGSLNAVPDGEDNALVVMVEDNDIPVGLVPDVSLDEDDLPYGGDDDKESLTAGAEVPIFHDWDTADLVTLDISGLPTVYSRGALVEYDLEMLDDGVTQRVTAVALSDDEARVVFTLDFAPNGNGHNYAYSATLSDVIDHPAGGEDITEFVFGIDINGDDALPGAGQFTFRIVDDVPVTSDDGVAVVAVPTPSFNLLFVLDTSGSMIQNVLQDGGSYKSRVDIMRDAVSELLSEYEGVGGAFNISIIDFDAQAQLVFSGTSIADAQAFISDTDNLVPGGPTNYASALADDANGAQGVLSANLINPDLADFSSIAYFISDGVPYPSSGQVPLDEGLQNPWQLFVDANGIEVVSVGIGTNLDTEQLNLVENAGEDALVVASANDLEAVLIDTVPEVKEGNVVSNGIVDKLGGDDAFATQLVFQTGDAALAATYEIAGATIVEGSEDIFSVLFDIPQNGDPLQITLDTGGMFSIDMLGSYVFEAAIGVPAGAVHEFDYVLTDGDGDISRATLSFTFINDGDELEVVGAVDNRGIELTGNASGELLVGTSQDDTIEGAGGDDTLQGGSGDDYLSGGAGSDVFVIGDNDGQITIADFDVAEDTVDLDVLFDALSLGDDSRSQGDAWDLEIVSGTATLTVSAADTPVVMFENLVDPSAEDLSALASRISVGDES